MSTMFEYVEAVGISPVSIEDAIQKAVEGISKTRQISWFEVVSFRGRVLEAPANLEYQVTVRFGCKS